MPMRHCLAAVFLLIVMLSGCASLVQAPRVTLKETSMIGLDTSGIDIEFLLAITNPNSFDLSLLGYTFDLQVLALPLSTGGMQETILFPAGKETGMRLPVRLKFADLLKIIKRSPDPDKIPYQLNTVLHLKTPLARWLSRWKKAHCWPYRSSTAPPPLQTACGMPCGVFAEPAGGGLFA